MPKFTMKKKEYFDKKTNPLNDKEKIRLNKFISNSGICSRREADKFIKAGVVTVNGIGITELGYKVNLSDVVKFNDQKIKTEQHQYVLLNKPKNYCCKLVNNEIDSAINLVKSSCKEKIYPTDKLSKSDTGLIIFTNDNLLIRKMKNNRLKTIYHINLSKNLKQEDLEKIREGMFVNEKKIKAKSVSYIGQNKNEIGIELNTGSIKHVKNIFKTLNYEIKKTDRVFLAGLTKKNLPRKNFRHLSKSEVNILMRL